MGSRHEDLLRSIRKEVQAVFSMLSPNITVRTFRQDTSTSLHQCPVCHAKLPRYQLGTEGSCDLRGYVTTDSWPWPFEIECKVGRDRLRPAQIDYKTTCLILHVPHYVAHATSPDDIPAVAREAALWVHTSYISRAAG